MSFRRFVAGLALVAAALVVPAVGHGQQGGSISGRVTNADDQSALAGVQVSVRGQNIASVTGTDGRYRLARVPAGTVTVVFRWVGYAPSEQTVTVVEGGTATLDAALSPTALALSEIVVTGASRAPERIVEAPASISIVDPQLLQSQSLSGQAPIVLGQVPGVDLAQNGMNDFNVNTRGFNSSLNRRVLTLLDGRDLAVAFLGSQEWNGLPVAIEDLDKIELIRGPGSALYGNNAFSGVLNMRSPLVRDTKGARLSLGGGELATFRADGRYSWISDDQRLGVRVSGGYNTSDTWTRSRTAFDRLDLQREYAASGVSVPATTVPEAVALRGQTRAAGTGLATGDRDPIRNIYGSARVDYYAPSGSVLTVEGGAANVENETFVTGIGRVQVYNALKPYARAMWSDKRFNLMAYWNGRRADSDTGQISLASGAVLLENSDIFHVEGQTNFAFDSERGRVVLGTSYRRLLVNTSGTLMRPVNDDRSDWIGSGYAQVEYAPLKELKFVAASRVDDGNLFTTQLSPKGAVVVSPTEDHSFHASVNRAFMTPNYSEFFLSAAAGAPANFSLLEAGLRASPLGPALAGVPSGQLFTTSAAVPVRAEGNAALVPEEVLGFELGYKGTFGRKLYVTVDGYWSRITNFVTDLLPGINPAFGAWTAPDAVPAVFRPDLEAAVRQQLLAAGQQVAAAGLTRIDGNTAIVVSYGNAGEVEQRGVELSASFQATDEIRLDGTFTWFDFTIKQQQAGDLLLPNTPGTKGTVGVSYVGARTGLDANVSLRLVSGFDWAAGVFAGTIPSQELLNASVGYRVNNNVRVNAAVTNLLDQQRYNIFGGAVIGRRLLGGITTTF